MTASVFSDAMGEISEKYIMEAITYQRKRKKHSWNKWIAAAACICLVVATIFPLFQKDGGSPFSLTAYAIASDNTVSSVVMQEGENIPVSFFEANNGLKGFIFSYKANKPQNHLSFSIMTDGAQTTVGQQIEAINGLDLSKDNIYVFYIPAQDQPAPHSVPLTMEDEASNTLALLNVVIEETTEGYTARIDSFTVYEKTTKPVK